MTMRSSGLLAALVLLAQPAVAESGQRHADQAYAYDGVRRGTLLPLPEIERRIARAMPGAQYLGMEFDNTSAIYTFKFLRNGTVIWVEVDGRSGEIVGRTGR